MLAGFLAVLKIIGIVLLCILAFLLVLILLILFVPIFYKADYEVAKTDLDKGFDIEKVNASARFSWLLFVIRGGIEFPKNREFILRVFGIKILPGKKKADKEDGSEDKKKTNKEDAAKSDTQSTGSTDQSTDENITGQTEQNADEKSAETDSGQSTEDSSSESGSAQEDKKDDGEAADKVSKEEENEEDGKSFLDVLWDIIDAVDNFLKTPINVLEKIQYTISRVCGKIDMIKTTIESDIFQRAFDLVKGKLVKVIKMILPDRIDIDLLFGTGDPASTAQLMGAYGALYPVLFRKVRFTPDFEDKVVASKGHIKGHITVFTIVYSAAVCYFNKDVRKTIKRFKTIIRQ